MGTWAIDRKILPIAKPKFAPSYAEAPTYMGTAREMLPKPSALTPLEQMPEYKKAMQTVNISKLPQYAQASTKTTLDPEYYRNKWNLAEGDINKSYMKKGGYYDRMMEGLNERGLGTSGETNYQTREVGSNLAQELAKAYQGIETERMGNQMNLDESFANRMGGLLGTQAGYNQQGIQGAQSMLGQRTGQNVTQQAMDWAGSQGQAGLANILANAYNTNLGTQYGQAAQAGQAQQQLEADKLNAILDIAGQGKFEGEGYDTIMNAILSQMGYPVDQEAARKEDQRITRERSRIAGYGSPNPLNLSQYR